MNTVITPSVGRAVETVETVMIENRAPTSIKTTLYDLIVAIQDAVEPGEETLVVSTVVHLLCSGQATFLGDTSDPSLTVPLD